MEKINEGKELVFSGAMFFCSSNGFTLKWCIVSHKFLKLIATDHGRYWIEFGRCRDIFKTYCIVDSVVLGAVYGNSIYDITMYTPKLTQCSFYYSDCIAI